MAKGVKTITVIGGGLAGLSLGIGLRRAGIPVELHEASNYPRHRVCGEFISGLGAETVKALGLETALEGCLEHQSSVWFVRGKRIFSGRLPVAARAISRFELDMRLMELFVDLGGRMHQRSRFMEEDGEGLVWAAGRQRVRASTWVGLKAHFLKVPMAEGLEMHLGDGLYIGLTLIEGERVNVCGLMRGPINIAKKGSDMLLELMRLRGLGELAERLGAGAVDPASFTGVSALGFGKADDGDGFRLGDAHSLIPPFTGNGMTMAFQAAETALPLLVSYANGDSGWEEAVDQLRRRLQARFGRRLRAAAFLHPFLTKPLAQTVLSVGGRLGCLPFQRLYHAVR